MSKIRTLIATLLPGIFLIGYNVGTGSITSMSKAGANFGLDLLWTILVSCLITYYLINLFSRYTMVTGETVIQGIKNHISPWLAGGLIVALSMIIISALTGVLGIIAEVLETWSRATFRQEIASVWWALLVAVVLYVLLLIGNYAFFEKVLAVLVAIMGTAFIATLFIRFPPVSELARGLIPSIPASAEGSDNSPLVIIAGMVGTTVSVFAFVIRSQIVQTTGWKMQDNYLQRRDAAVSASLMFLISAAVMITAAATLHTQGIRLNSVAEMIPLLEPIAGPLALSVFVVGIVAAGLSSHLPNLLVIPWLIIDYKGQERNTQTTPYRIILLILSVLSVIGVAMGFRPVFIMLISQACLAIVLPVTLAAVIYLTSRQPLMHSDTNTTLDLIVQVVILGFALYISSLGVQGVITDLFD